MTPERDLTSAPGRTAVTDPERIADRIVEALDVRLDRNDVVGGLIRAWAEVGAGLDFTLHHLASESFITIAEDPESVRDIAQLLGYSPAPGVAASTMLAFQVRSTEHVEPEAVVPAGLQVRSNPENGDSPRVFETSEDVTVRAEWSDLAPAPPEPGPFIVSGLTTDISFSCDGQKPKVGDGVLFSSRPGARSATLFRQIRTVERGSAAGVFDVGLEPAFPDQRGITITDPVSELMAVRTQPFGATAQFWREAPDKVREPIGTRAGWVMARLPGDVWRPFRAGLPPVDVLCLAVDDRDGAVIAGTDGQGVFRLAPSSSEWATFGHGLEKECVTALAIGDGHVYAGTSEERVHVLDAETATWQAMGDRVQKFRHGRRRGPDHKPFPRGPVRAILAGNLFGKHLLFAGTDRGVFRWLDENRGWHGRSPDLPSWDLDTAHTSVWALALDDVVYDLFVATSEGVYRSRSLGARWHKRMGGVGDESARINDLVITSADRKRRRTMFMATDSGAYVSTNGGGDWTSTGDRPVRLDPVACIAAKGPRHLIAGGHRGTGRWSPESGGWASSIAPEPTDPNLRQDPMADVRAIVEDPVGRRIAAMPRGDFLEYDWPHFWIHFPTLDIPAGSSTTEAGSSIVLHNRLGADLLITKVRAVGTLERRDYGLDATVQRLQLIADNAEDRRLAERFPIRHTDVFVGGTPVELVVEPTDQIVALCDERVVVPAGTVAPPTGRHVAIRGTPARVEVHTLGGVERTAEGTSDHVGLAWHDVTALTNGRDDAVLAVAGPAVWALDPERVDWAPVALPALEGTVRSLAVHPDGTFVAHTSTGIVLHGEGDTGWRVDPIARPARDLIGLTIDAHGVWWSVGGGQIWRRAGFDTPWETTEIPLPTAADEVRSIAMRGADRLILGTHDGSIHEHRDADWVRIATVPDASRGIAVGGDGSVFSSAASSVMMSDGASLRAEPLLSTSTIDAAALAQGRVPTQLEHTLSKAVGAVGPLRVTGHEGAVTLIRDDEHRTRYSATADGDSVRIGRLPRSMPIDKPPVDLGNDRTLWHVDSNHRSITFACRTSRIAVVKSEPSDRSRTELGRVAQVEPGDRLGRPTIVLERPVTTCYDPTTFRMDANTVDATEGATVHQEVIGSGDEHTANQSFSLAHPNVTYLSTPDGVLSTVVVEITESGAPIVAPFEEAVDSAAFPNGSAAIAEGRRWTEVRDLSASGPFDKVFEVHTREGRTTIRFGDGVNGSRLPTGHGNVRATYRYGSPHPARLAAGQLTLLASRPRGIIGVTNPVPTSGGAEPESGRDVRQRAPASTRSLGRIVSLEDHRFFAEDFPGVGRASVDRLAGPDGPVVHVSVASSDGTGLGEPVLDDLHAAITRASASVIDVVVQESTWRWMTIDARVTVASDVDARDVERVVVSALAERFAVGASVPGRSVAAAEVVALIQRQRGVVGVDLRRFTADAGPDEVVPMISARLARWDDHGGPPIPASLVAARPGDIAVTTSGGVR